MKKQKEIILILVSIFIVSIAWIVFNLYHNAVTSTISQPLNEDIKEINPSFNTEIIKTLKNRIYVDPIYSITQQKEENNGQTTNPIQTASVSAMPKQKNVQTETESRRLPNEIQ